MLQKRIEGSERKAYRVVGQSRTVQRYMATVRADEGCTHAGELWTREVVTVAPGRVHFTSGPSETFASREEALAAGLAWRNAQQQP